PLPLMASPSASIVTDEAVGTDLARAVAFYAPPHLKRGVLFDHPHLRDRTVTFLARDARVHVAHVRKMHVVRQVVDADPRDRYALLPVLLELANAGGVGAEPRRAIGLQMAAGADLDAGDPRIDRLVRRVVAVHTGDLVHARVQVVRERYWLVRVG